MPSPVRTSVRPTACRSIGALQTRTAPFPHEARDRARAHRLLEGELHPVRPERRRRQPERPGRAQLLVEEHAALRRLVVGLVQDHEIHFRRRLLEQRDGTDVVAVEVAVRLHHLPEQVVARRHPADLEPPPQVFLQAVDDLKGHVHLPRADRRFEQHGRAVPLRKRRQARCDRLDLVGPPFVFRHLTPPPARTRRC
mgnify:CR=1 FL=1